MSWQSLVTFVPRPQTADAPARPLEEPAAPPSAPQTPAPEALRVVDLRKEFRSGFLRRRLRGIEGVSFSVPQGGIFALLGHNGAGKTTTINCILDLVHPDGGEVAILGRPAGKAEARVGVGYLPERPYFFEHLSGRELLEFYADLIGVPARERRAQIERILDLVGLRQAAGRSLRKYSKGMLQRIGLGQALLGDPRLLILDEPLSGLDPIGRKEVRELLLELRGRGKTIVLSSHIVPDIELLADAVGIMREGRLVCTRTLAELHEGVRYRVNLDGRRGRPLEGALAGFAQRRRGDALQVEAPDVEGLRQLLDACAAGGAQVLNVETARTGLEDLFLSLHQGGKEAGHD